jgi:cell shape-determining protein MreC
MQPLNIRVKELSNQIIDADLSKDDINALWSVLKDKYKLIKSVQLAKAKANLSVGDRVVTRGLKPKYLNGLIGTVNKIKKTRADIELSDELKKDSMGGFQWRKYVINGVFYGIPIACLDKQEGKDND